MAASTERSRAEEIAGLRALADFLDAHPEVYVQSQVYNVYVTTREDIAAIARATSWQKVYNGDYFILRKVFSGGIRLDVFTDRETVCRPVITGTRLVPAVEAQPAREEDVVEWVCEHESLLAPETVADGQ